MKKIFLISLLWIAAFVQAQTTPNERKVIHVTGSSEMEVVPDEIYFSIVLSEYIENKIKTPIATLEEQLTKAVSSSGLDSKNLEIDKVYGQGWVKKKRKQDEYIERKTYRLKVSDPSIIDQVLEKLDAKGIENVYVSHFSHSRIEEFRKQLKIQAIKNAKEKAGYLLEAIGEKLGTALSVTESESRMQTIGGFYMDQDQISNNEYRFSNSVMQGTYSSNTSAVSFKTMKLRFEISATFEIK